MNRTATILAEMRNELRNTIAAESNPEVVEAQDKARRLKVRRLTAGHNLSGERYPVATRTGRESAALSATLMDRVHGSHDMRNAIRRDCSLPARAMSLCASRGRVQPGQVESLMAFFQSPSALAAGILATLLPKRPAGYVADAVAYLAENGIVATPAEIKALKLYGSNRGMADGGGAPRQVSHYTPGVEAPPAVKRGRGRPAGAKIVDHLTTLTWSQVAGGIMQGVRPTYGPEPTYLIPGGNDAGQGAGHDQGAGWATSRIPLTPAQVGRRNAALEQASHGYRTDAEGNVIERW